MIIREMRQAACYELVKDGDFARLGCCKDGQPYVVPIRYAYSDSRLLSFSMPGRKVDFMRTNPKVCLEIEHFSDPAYWKCVVIEGIFHELAREEERDHAWKLLQGRKNWWEPGALKPEPQEITGERSHLYYEIIINQLTGREAVEL
jgi:nitroimidazol reductase NimA-like FMN-containing flavoprotein (pyridoxamine 5'-phosphate oxidase superfamily)